MTREPSELCIGCAPFSDRSMMASRLCPKVTWSFSYIPTPSGPRCEVVAFMRPTSSLFLRVTPLMPHIYLLYNGVIVRREIILTDKYLLKRHCRVQFIEYQHSLAIFA